MIKCITNDSAKILLNFKTIYFNNGPNPNCVTQTYLGKIQNLEVGGPVPCPEKDNGGPRPMRPPWFRHLWQEEQSLDFPYL